ncbi:alpha-L-fucosidase [candidate division KSB1 bacterium]|nr:alpha-L-fucosidase [candidate division KSB1 bacterium]
MKSISIILILTLFYLPEFLQAQQIQPKRPQNYQPYRYKYSIEKLQKSYSKSMIKAAKAEMAELIRINNEGRYKASLESLDTHPTPEWYVDAKLGIFYDWGPYSIAGYGEKGWSRARYPDWYLNHLYGRYKAYHEATWGKDFQRDDFIGLFTAENFNAEEIVQLAKQAGAKYFVPFNKHHDGFCLWDSKFTQRDVVDMVPGRDLTGELVEACEKAGLYHGFYFSVEDYEYPVIVGNGKDLKIRLWSKEMAPDNAGVIETKGEVFTEFNPVFHNRILSGKIPVTNFIDEYIVPQAKDFIDKYHPDILWFDGEWQRPAEYYKTPEIVAYFYNQAEGKKEVVANDRLGKGTREHHGDFYTSETDEVVTKMDYPWEENRSMSESYGYNWSDSLKNYLRPDELIKMLVRIVAKGGNLNLIVNPDGSGKIPEIQQNLLRELGKWLAVNGEAIYNTRPYEVLCDNTQLGQPVWYTMSKDSTYGYAIIFNWPKSETFICTGANIKWDTEVYMLGYDKPLKWVDTGRKLWALSAKIPAEILIDHNKRPCQYAWVLKFEYDKDNKFSN